MTCHSCQSHLQAVSDATATASRDSAANNATKPTPKVMSVLWTRCGSLSIKL